MIDAAEKLPSKSYIIDGEMMAAPDPDGTPNFHEMHSRMAAARGPLRRAQPADNQWKMRSNGAGKREQKDTLRLMPICSANPPDDVTDIVGDE